MANNVNQEEIYHKYLEILRVKIIENYDELGLRASGNFEKELEKKVQGNKLTLLGSEYSEFMDKGRKPGASPVVTASDISHWIDVKRSLPDFFRVNKIWLSYVIANRINREGIEVPNIHNRGRVISEVVESFLDKDMKEMLDELGIVFLRKIESDIVDILRNVSR